ncbi:MAG: nucleotide exchange factor GrpE [Pseudomonadota bacterium]
MTVKKDSKQRVKEEIENEITGDEVQGAGTSEDEQDAKSLTDELEAAQAEAKGHYDKLLRVMAEFENFKKRISREHTEYLKYGNEKLLNALIPVIDDFERVLDHIPPDAKNELKSFGDGMELVHKNVLTVLAKFGLKEVEALGKEFDPNCHEAIGYQPSSKYPQNIVMEVHRKGYWMQDRLLRAAMVTVSQGKTKKEG